jgi:TRAP-type uncharacterized transport system substrate-binding protein
MSVRRKLVKILWKWVAPIAGLSAIGLAVFFYFHSPQPKAYHLRLTAGNAVGMRHHLALRLQSDVARRNLTFEPIPSAGSEEGLDWVNRREVDVAFVQGALSSANRPNVREVAALHIEPMHLLVKKELFKDVTTSLTALRGKTVDLERVGSGTHTLARAILEFADLRPRDEDPAGGYIPVSLDRKVLHAETDTARLPDAVFLVSTLPSPTAAYLVTHRGYRLVPLPFAEAFSLRSLAAEVGDQSPGPAEERVAMGRIQAVTIPAFTYGVEPAVPDQPLPTIGTRMLLVAHKDVPAKAMYQLVEAIYSADFGQIVRPPLDSKLMDLPPEFAWHDGAVLYQQRNAPVLSGQAMDSAHKSFAIFAAAASGLFVLWQWFKQSRRLTRDKRFNKYIVQVARIEESAMKAEQDGALALGEFLELQDKLCRLKIQALEEFTREELTGDALLSGFLMQVNDARSFVARLIQQQEARSPS